MRIEYADLIDGSERDAEEGNNDPKRCLMRLADGSTVAGYTKRLDAAGLAREVVCALILRNWGLSVPTPYLLRRPDGELGFGSADDGYPNLKQSLNFDDELPTDVRHDLRVRAASIVSTFSQTPIAIAADEAIGNRDRHLANILWDGKSVAWIDHEGCFGRSPEEDQNRLVNLVCLLGDFDKIRDASMQAADQLNTAPKATPSEELQAYFQACGDGSISDGLALLAQKVLSRFPQPHDLLHDASKR